MFNDMALFKKVNDPCNQFLPFFPYSNGSFTLAIFVAMRVHILRTFVTHLLVHIYQKEKIAAKIASVNGP
jgi:hypothetical protein